jgi:hypothetical protein
VSRPWLLSYRVSKYFISQELATLTGQPPERFATVLMKELADNALDAAEAKGVLPELTFEVNVAGEILTITVTDNGLGIPPETVASILDFSTKTSDKTAYRSPTRGAQGNALMTLRMGCDRLPALAAGGSVAFRWRDWARWTHCCTYPFSAIWPRHFPRRI